MDTPIVALSRLRFQAVPVLHESARLNIFYSTRLGLFGNGQLDAMEKVMKNQLAPALALGLVVAFAPLAYSQAASLPTIDGVVSTASYTTPLAPGSLVSIFGSHLSLATQSAASGGSLPTSLGGTGLTFDGIPAGLLFVSPNQINAQIPSSVKANGSTVYSTESVSMMVVSTPVGSSSPAQVSIFEVGPGLYTSDSSGCGPAAALNIGPGGAISVNGPSNSAAPGDYISLFGTGLGIPSVVPPDGTAAATADSFTGSGGIYLDRSTTLIVPSYSGLAPSLVGVDQINFQIPSGTRGGCAVPVSMESADATSLSPLVTISVNASRGQCVDPPVQSYGEVSLEKTIASGTSSDGETDEFNAVFPAGPGLQQPPLPAMEPGTNHYNFWTPASSGRACPVAGDSKLSAGTIVVQTQGQPGISAPPTILAAGGVSYRQPLPAGFVQAGEHTLSSQANAPTAVVFQNALAIGSGITIQNDLSPGTILTPSSNTQITWTGGDATELVRIVLVDDTGDVASPKDIWYASGSDGSVELSFCTGGIGGSPKVCSYGLPSSGNVRLLIDVLPAGGVGNVQGSVLGISQQVRFSWAYHYVFGGLSIIN